MNYAEYRAKRIRWADLGGTVSSAINNTGYSRQLRRSREREFAKANLSATLINALGRLHNGQGLFVYGGHMRYYVPAWPTETRQPKRDYSKRYASLFPVLPDATGD